MYTEIDKENNVYEDEYDDTYYDKSRRNLIIKIIIIVICVIVLILLILSLKKNRNVVVNDPKIHANNIETVRLASEEYFFIQNNLPSANQIKNVTVEEIGKNTNLSEIVDANKKVCNLTTSNVSLQNEASVYTMKILLACSTNEKEEVFYYSKKDFSCLNCSGKSHTIIIDDDTKEDPEEKDDYSCSTWSDWSSERINNNSLIERVRTLVKGVKYGSVKEKIVYGEWTDYNTTPIVANDNLEVETKTEVEQVWSETKTTTSFIQNSDTIKVLSYYYVGGNTYTYCPEDYKQNGNKCYSNIKERGDLTYSQYTSGNYTIYNKPCDAIKNEKNSDGKYELVYKNCLFSRIINANSASTGSYIVYEYQELENKNVTYYRSRSKSITTVKEADQYTDKYYEEKDLPKGYVKLDGSEKKEYSYKYPECEK